MGNSHVLFVVKVVSLLLLSFSLAVVDGFRRSHPGVHTSQTPVTPACRCAAPCQLDTSRILAAHSSTIENSVLPPLCTIPDNSSGTCPQSYIPCSRTSIYQWEYSPPLNGFLTDSISISFLASDLRESFVMALRNANTVFREKWWLSFTPPSHWIDVAPGSETLLTLINRHPSDNQRDTEIELVARTCSSIPDLVSVENFCTNRTSSSQYFVDLASYFKDLHLGLDDKFNQSTLVIRKKFYSAPYNLDKMQYSEAPAIMNIHYLADSKNEEQNKIVVQSFTVAQPQAVANIGSDVIDSGFRSSAQLQANIDTRQLDLLYTTSSVLGQVDSNMQICISLDPIGKCAMKNDNFHGSKIRFNTAEKASVSYVSNPFKRSFVGNRTRSTKPNVRIINATYFCIEDLMAEDNCDAVGGTSEKSEVSLDLRVSQLLVPLSYHNSEPIWNSKAIFGAQLFTTLFNHSADEQCVQLTIAPAPASKSKNRSIYSVISVMLYALGLCAALLVVRMHGMSFSSMSFWTDLMSLCVVLNFTFYLSSNLLWLSFDFDKNEAIGALYMISKLLALCVTWTMVLSACYHWYRVLKLTLFKVPKRAPLITFIVLNAIYYILVLASIFHGVDFYKCAYKNYLKDPDPLKNPCGTTFCADMQPAQWYRAHTEICNDESNSAVYPSIIVGTSFSLVVSIAIAVLGFSVYRMGSRVLKDHHRYEVQTLQRIRQALQWYMVMIVGISLVYLVQWVLTVVLFQTNTIVHPAIWYIFGQWIPFILPPCGFLFLQWNPKLHGLSHHSKDTILGNNNELSMENERNVSSRCSSISLDYDTASRISDVSLSRGGLQERRRSQYISGTSSSSNSSRILAGKSSYLSSSLSVSVSLCLPTNTLKQSSGCYYYVTLYISDAEQRFVGWTRLRSTESIMYHRPEEATTTTGVDEVLPFSAVLNIPAWPNASVKFILYEAEDSTEEEGASTSELATTDALFEFTTSLESLVEATEDQVDYHIPGVLSSSTDTTSSPTLFVKGFFMSHEAVKKHIPGYSSSRSFFFNLTDGDMVVEDMYESEFADRVPMEFLSLILKDRRKLHAEGKSELAQFEARHRRASTTTNLSGAAETSANYVSGGVAGFYEVLIDQIHDQEHVRRRRKWLIARNRKRLDYVQFIKSCIRLYKSRERKQVFFKSSTEKKLKDLSFLPINMHVQDTWIGPSADLNSQMSRRTSKKVTVYDVVTVGAAAAHTHRFKRGGLMSLCPQLDALKTKFEKKKSIDSEYIASQQTYDDMHWGVLTRFDEAFSQGLSALVTSFCRKLEAALQSPNTGVTFIHQLRQHGFLFQVENLLSTHGNENGMLEDYAKVVTALNQIEFVVEGSNSSCYSAENYSMNLNIPKIGTSSNGGLPGVKSVKLFARKSSQNIVGNYPYSVRVEVCDSGDVKVAADKADEKKLVVPVTAVIFTQGINEMQSFANTSTSRKSSLQYRINEESLHRLERYCHKVCGASLPPSSRTGGCRLQAQLQLLEIHILASKGHLLASKHVGILQISSHLCRLLHAGRVTSCKSAKDRTGMSVTLEMAHLMHEYHGLDAADVQMCANAMRSHGVRLINAWKNTGEERYAFNALQRSLFPVEYRCPHGTFKAGLTT